MIDVHIELMPDGQVHCAARMKDGETLTSLSLIALVGAMESAKLSLLAGRWALFGKNGSGEDRYQAFNPFNADWERMQRPNEKPKRKRKALVGKDKSQ